MLPRLVGLLQCIDFYLLVNKYLSVKYNKYNKYNRSFLGPPIFNRLIIY